VARSGAFVTGAGGALGRAIAGRLAADGWDVAVLDVDAAGIAGTVKVVEQAGGRALPLTVDLRDADASSMASFGAPEITLGWIGGGGMTTFLSRAAGPSNAAWTIMTGERIDAARALAWHLVSEVVEPAGLLARARELATTIASRAPIAAETAKVNLRAAYSLPEEKAIEYERDLQTVCFATEDAAEGRRAFAEKRPPVFHRR
jgi:enoyl-CoA hydratase/carnithine racemase